MIPGQSENSKINVLILDDQQMWLITTEKICSDILQSISNDTKKDISNLVRFFKTSKIDEAKAILQENRIHLFLLDKDLGHDSANNKLSGVDLIPEFKSIQPLTQIIMLTADNSTKDIASALRRGASDYLFKSDENDQKEYRIEVIKKTLEMYADDLAKAKSVVPIKKGLYSNYVNESLAMRYLDLKLGAISESNRPVLLLGETGLGKGAVARRINALRKEHLGQAHREFVQLNIAATEKNLVESILFGTEPGAFTDAAKKTKAGLLDIAKDGDIFLDEIGDASIDLQLKILKLIEEKEYFRVGGNRSLKTNARFIFATNKDLQALIRAKQFREDLYMRISVFEETMPLLKDRKSDIPLIVEGFLSASRAESNKKNISITDFPPDLLNYFLRDEIQGNIRGIENDIERLVAHTKCDHHGRPQLQDWKKILGHQVRNSKSSGALTVEQLKSAKTSFLDKDFPGLWELTELVEQKVLEEVDARGLSIEQAAKLLKVSINTVWSRKKQFAIKQNQGSKYNGQVST